MCALLTIVCHKPTGVELKEYNQIFVSKKFYS